jgi:hypothetical protein
MFQQLVSWMDAHFGHHLTNIAINTTIIGRGVDAAFATPELRAYHEFKDPIKILLQTGFAHEYRHSTWSDIFRNRAYAHVVDRWSGTSLEDLPEVKSLIVTAMSYVDAEKDKENRNRFR